MNRSRNRRRRRICALSCRWCWRFSWRFARENRRKLILNSKRFSWIFASWTGRVGRIRTLTFRSYQNYQHVSPLCRTTSVYSCTIHHSAGLVSLQHHSRPAVSSQAVNCCTQHVNKWIQLSSGASGRCHTNRALCGGKLLVRWLV